MKKIRFTKMNATGNDFLVIDNRLGAWGLGLGALRRLVGQLCQRRTGIGADGLLVIEDSKSADIKMRIFNPDGSEAEMCGNGLRCVAVFAGGKKQIEIETKAGIYKAEVTAGDKMKIRMEDPKALKLDFPISIDGRMIRTNFINTGVPHTVIFVERLNNIDVETIGPKIRYHEAFKPRGTNVDFVEVIDDKNIKMRTYERGVEAETLACGTGAVASAIIAWLKASLDFARDREGSRLKANINVLTRGGKLGVYFERDKRRIKNVFLEGEAKIVYKGEIYV